MTDSKDQNPPKTPKPPKPPKTPETTGTTKKPENWLLQKIKENPFQFFWSLGLTLGGAILIIFFLQMGFMPDMNFPEALDIFIATASIGLLIVFPMFLAIMPAILTRAFYFTKKTYGNGGLLTVNTFLAFGVVICFIQNYMAIAILICLFIFFIYLGCLCYDLYQEKQQKDNKQISDNYEKILIYIPCAAIWSIYPRGLGSKHVIVAC